MWVFKAFGEASGGSGGSPLVCLPDKEFCVLEVALRDDAPATAAAYDGRNSLCAVLERYEGTSETVLGVSDSNTSFAEELTTNGRCQL